MVSIALIWSKRSAMVIRAVCSNVSLRGREGKTICIAYLWILSRSFKGRLESCWRPAIVFGICWSWCTALCFLAGLNEMYRFRLGWQGHVRAPGWERICSEAWIPWSSCRSRESPCPVPRGGSFFLTCTDSPTHPIYFSLNKKRGQPSHLHRLTHPSNLLFPQ